MIIQDYSGSFGSRVTRIQTMGNDIIVSTAKEGLFKGLSTVVIMHDQIQAKFIYNTSLSKKARQDFHLIVAEQLNEVLQMYEDAETSIDLNYELNEIGYLLKTEDVITDYYLRGE